MPYKKNRKHQLRYENAAAEIRRAASDQRESFEATTGPLPDAIKHPTVRQAHGEIIVNAFDGTGNYITRAGRLGSERGNQIMAWLNSHGLTLPIGGERVA